MCRARYGSVKLKGFPKFECKKRWTDDDRDVFVKLFKKHGLKSEILKRAFPNRCGNFWTAARRIRIEIEEDPNHKYAHMFDLVKR